MLSKDGIFRLFGSAVVAQAVLSAANFAVGLLLIRYTDDVTYGRFVLVQAAVLLVIAAQRAWVIDPLTVIAAKRSPAEQQDMISGVKISQRGFLLRLALAVLLVPFVGCIAGWINGQLAALMAATILAAWAALDRDYLRGLLLLFHRSETVLGSDVVYVLVLVAGVLAAITQPPFVAVWATVALACAAWVGRWPAERSLQRSPGWSSADAAAYWREMRPLATWATVGATIYWVLGQGYNYILALKLDATAVAHVNAIRLLLMPTYLLTIGIKALLLPMSVRWTTEFGFVTLIRRLAVFVAVIAVLDCIYFVMLWFGSDWVLANVLNKDIPDHRFMIIMWSLLSLINLVRDVFLTALLVRRRFRYGAWAVALSAVTTVVSMWLALEYAGTPGALIGLAAGETVFLIAVLWKLWLESRITLPDEGRAVA